MGLVQSVLEGMSRLRADAEGGSSGAPAPWDDYWYYTVGAGLSTGIRITAETVKRIACVYACVGVIGKLVASFPLGIYREFDDGGKDLASKHTHPPAHRHPAQRKTDFLRVAPDDAGPSRTARQRLFRDHPGRARLADSTAPAASRQSD